MLVLEFQIPPFPLLATVGYTEWEAGVVHTKRQFDVFDLIVCSRGGLYMEEDGIRYEVSEGMMLVLEPGKTHLGYQPTDVKTEVYWIHFTVPSPVRPLLIEKNNWQQPLLQRTDQDIEPHPASVNIPKFASIDLKSIVPLLNEMISLHNVLTTERSFQLHVLFGQLLLILQQAVKNNSPQARSYLLGEQVADYIANHLGEPFDSGQLEEDLHYHFDYLARCLKQYVGMSPIQYRHHLQIEQAKRLLAHSDIHLKRIGELCGLPDNNYFTRIFKRQTALTPGEYRRIHQVFFVE